jgi:hypothetical protein
LEWFLILAARDGGVATNTAVWGIGAFNEADYYVYANGPCSPTLVGTFVPSDTWPGPMSGVATSWSPNCLSGDLVPLHWMAITCYSGASGTIPLGNFYPGQNAVVVSCDQPPEEDPFVDYGALGVCGDPGDQACPPIQPDGACCIDGQCFILTQAACEDAGGQFVGGPCDPDPCVQTGACCIDRSVPPDGNNESCIVTTLDDCLVQHGIYQGDGSDCDPNPCPPDPVATKSSTWGAIKSIYR